MGIGVDVKPFFWFGLYQICLMKKKKMKMKEIENGKEKNNQIFGSIIQSSQPSVVLHSTIYANLAFSPRIPIFSFIFILGIVTGITSRKALLFLFV